MKVKSIPLSKVQVPDVRVTAVYDEETLSLLRSTVEKVGVLQPIVVVQVEDHYELVDGLHRLEEERRLGNPHIDAVIYAGEAKDTLLLNLILNKVRGKTKASEMVMVVHELYDTLSVGIEQIEQETGLPRAYVEKMIKISQASPSVQDALDREILGVGHAEQIARLPTFAQQDEVVAKCAVWRWSIKDLKEQVENVLREMELLEEAPPTREVVRPMEYRCEVCRVATEPRNLRPVMLCPVCFGESYRGAQTRRDGEKETVIAAEESEAPEQ